MGMVMAAGPPASRGRVRTLRAGLALVAALVVSCAFGAASALADAGKVLVFTGTAGTANPATRDGGRRASGGRHGRRLHGRRDVRRDQDRRGEPRRLPRRRVRQLRRRRAQRRAGSRAAGVRPGRRRLRRHRRDGQARRGRQRVLRHADRPHRRLAHRRRARPAPRTSSSSTASTRPRATSTRSCKARNDNYYAWTNNPTGTVHTVARVRFNTLSGRHARSPTTPSQRFTGTTATRSSRSSSAPLSWCRDIQSGRSFYTGMGQTVGAYDDRAQQAPRLRRPVGRRHGPRRLQGDDQLQLHAHAPDAVEPDDPGAAGQRDDRQRQPVHGRDRRAGDGRRRPHLLRRPRGLLPGPAAVHAVDASDHGPRLRSDPRLRPARRGLARPEPVADHQGRRLHGARRQGRRPRDRR